MGIDVVTIVTFHRPPMHARAAARLVDDYLEERLTRLEIVPSSADAIRPVLLQWIRFVDGAPPRRWTTDQVARWVGDDRFRANYRKSRLTKLSPFVRWLVRRGRMPRDITLDIGRIHIPAGQPRDLTVDDVQALLRVCPDARAILIVIVMVQTGVRAGDAARIRIEDLDVRRRRLHVRGKGGRGELTHSVPVPDEAWSLITRWIDTNGLSSGPLLRSYQRPERGLQPATVSKLVGRWMRDAGLKHFPYDGVASHSLRHTCAQQMLDGGAELREVQFALGHSSIRSTERHYTLNEPTGLRAAMEGRRYLPGAVAS